MRMFFCAVCIAWVAIAGACLAQPVIVQNENVRFQTLPDGRFELTVCPTVICGDLGEPAFQWTDAPFTVFYYTGHSIVPEMVSADAQYYEVVDFGEIFHRYVDNVPFHGGEVGPGSFYLGIWALTLTPQQHSFGWVQLAPVNGVVTMIDNVMSYKSRGIIVGTTTVVPEPMTVLLLVIGFTTFPDRRRRR